MGAVLALGVAMLVAMLVALLATLLPIRAATTMSIRSGLRAE